MAARLHRHRALVPTSPLAFQWTPNGVKAQARCLTCGEEGMWLDPGTYDESPAAPRWNRDNTRNGIPAGPFGYGPPAPISSMPDPLVGGVVEVARIEATVRQEQGDPPSGNGRHRRSA